MLREKKEKAFIFTGVKLFRVLPQMVAIYIYIFFLFLFFCYCCHSHTVIAYLSVGIYLLFKGNHNFVQQRLWLQRWKDSSESYTNGKTRITSVSKNDHKPIQHIFLSQLGDWWVHLKNEASISAQKWLHPVTVSKY